MKSIIFMKSRKDYLERRIKELEKKTSTYPSGLLIVCKNGDRFKYFRQEQVSSGERTRTYIPHKNRTLIEALAKKAYYTKTLQNMKNELLAVQRYLNARKEPCELPAAYSSLLPSGPSDWEHADYERNAANPENLTVKAPNGLFVRSKSEAMIAYVLSDNRIPFRYECAHSVGGVKLYPDFTVLNPVTKKEFIWEHFGLIDNPSYRANMLSKLQLLITAGYIPGNNLIVTFETKDAPLDINHVENLVKFHFT